MDHSKIIDTFDTYHPLPPRSAGRQIYRGEGRKEPRRLERSQERGVRRENRKERMRLENLGSARARTSACIGKATVRKREACDEGMILSFYTLVLQISTFFVIYRVFMYYLFTLVRIFTL